MGLFRVGDKELRFVGVWAGIRHGKDSTVVELLETIKQLIKTSTTTGGNVEVNTLSVERISSSNGLPQILWPPLPVPPGSPV